MIKNLLMLSLLLASAPAFAQSDCAKSTDTCAAGTKKLSPFQEASLRESKPPHIETNVKKAAAPALPASTAAAAGLPAVPAETGGRLSSPAWLLLVIAGFAGLYFYLRGEEKKRRKK